MLAQSFSWRRSYLSLLVATVIVVATADFFFYGHAIGWTAAAFTAVMLILLSARDNRFIETVGGRVCALAAVGLIAALIEQPTQLNVTYAFICLGALALINTGGWVADFPAWVLRLGRWLAT